MSNLNSEQVNHAISDFMQEDSPVNYFETLSQFHAAWVESQLCDDTDGNQRSTMLRHYKSLRLLLYRLNRAAKQNKKEKKSKWIS